MYIVCIGRRLKKIIPLVTRIRLDSMNLGYGDSRFTLNCPACWKWSPCVGERPHVTKFPVMATCLALSFFLFCFNKWNKIQMIKSDQYLFYLKKYLYMQIISTTPTTILFIYEPICEIKDLLKESPPQVHLLTNKHFL